MNPYRVLDLPSSATAADIKKAYRQMAAKHHPDHGGDVETMKTATLAHDILIDPKRRRRFDETGDIEDHRVSNEVEATIASMLADAFANDDHDPIKQICRRLDARRTDFQERARKCEEGRDDLVKKIERFEKANEKTTNIESRDFILASLRNGLTSLVQSIESSKEQDELMTQCLTYLNDLHCPPESHQFSSSVLYRGGPSPFRNWNIFAGSSAW